MAFCGMLFKQLLFGVLVLAAVAAPETNSSCNRTCGSVSIPYPFGTSEGCYLHPSFLITCNYTFNPPKPFLTTSSIKVLNISLDGELRVSNLVAENCNTQDFFWTWFRLEKFIVSSKKNKFTAVGCNTVAYIEGRTSQKNFTTGCVSRCDSIDSVVNGSCNGVGCCQSSVPENVTYFEVSVGTLENRFNVQSFCYVPERLSAIFLQLNTPIPSLFTTPTPLRYPLLPACLLAYVAPASRISFNPCSFGFLVEETAYKFSSLDLINLQNKKKVPVVLDWAVGNKTCQEAQKNQAGYACKAKSSECDNSTNGPGYRCCCSSGYEGNPYIPDGCKDIDECKISKPCGNGQQCINLVLGFRCVCLKGYEDDGSINATSCMHKGNNSRSITIALCIAIGFSVLLVGAFSVYWVVERRHIIKLKEKLFQQNGGLLLQQQLSNYGGSIETTEIFSIEELKKATNNYDESMILGQGGNGIVYKGILPGDKVVAIKKSKLFDQSQVKQFINEVVLLTHIDHRNVVKLLGCCLEIEVPLLVYEFITNGTLFHHLHDDNLSALLSWEIRLQIAIEIAGVLAYLHSEASMPIIHRDIKSANILLDDNLTAKVADFGASRLISVNEKQATTLVQGTHGYLDPESFQTSQLTEKSDVYSFGVVLAELLTGKKVVFRNSTGIERKLAVYFVSMMKEDRLSEILDTRITNEGNIKEQKEVAHITKGCLSVSGEDRPSMREVAMELECLRTLKKHPWEKADSSIEEETEYLLTKPTNSLDIEIGTDFYSTSATDGYDSIRNNKLEALMAADN